MPNDVRAERNPLAAIREAEQEVAGRIARAEADAKEQVARARVQAREIEEEAQRTARREMESELEAVRRELAAERVRLLAAADGEAQEIRERASARQAAVVVAVLAYILPDVQGPISPPTDLVSGANGESAHVGSHG